MRAPSRRGWCRSPQNGVPRVRNAACTDCYLCPVNLRLEAPVTRGTTKTVTRINQSPSGHTVNERNVGLCVRDATIHPMRCQPVAILHACPRSNRHSMRSRHAREHLAGTPTSPRTSKDAHAHQEGSCSVQSGLVIPANDECQVTPYRVLTGQDESSATFKEQFVLPLLTWTSAHATLQGFAPETRAHMSIAGLAGLEPARTRLTVGRSAT